MRLSSHLFEWIHKFKTTQTVTKITGCIFKSPYVS